MKKQAYPNNPNQDHANPHDLDKWLEAFQEVLNQQQFVGRKQAVDKITSDWDTKEKSDFINWMRYYEGSNHLKYKKANITLENGFYVPNDGGPPSNFKNEKALMSSIPGSKSLSQEDDSKPDPEFAALDPKKEKLEAHKRKLISRLDSLEKLLRSDISLGFPGAEISNFIRAIHDLKVKFYNLKLASLNTYNDLVHQKSNLLISKGFVKSASMLLAHAQLEAAPPAINSTNVDNATPTNNLQQGPLVPASDPQPAIDLKEAPKDADAAKKFLKNMSGGTITNVDKNKSDDIEIEVDNDDDVEILQQESDDENLLVVTAQEVLPNAQTELNTTVNSPPTPLPNPILSTDVSSKDNDVALEVNSPSSSNEQDIDDLIEKAFGTVTPEMIILKLEEVSKIFKTKEIPRQLSIVDFMLDKLGMSTFFPQLSEASGKAIESSNYISSRIDDVLSRLRGIIKGNGIDLVNGESSGNAAVEAIKQKLREQEDKAEAKKQDRINSEEKPTPVLEIEQPDVEPQITTDPLPEKTTDLTNQSVLPPQNTPPKV